MAEFEDKLNSILSNPALMGQIMSMAGSLSQAEGAAPAGEPRQEPPQRQKAPSPEALGGMGGLDPGAMLGMMELLRSTQIHPREQKLLNALQGYLPPDRLEKLMKAMQASRIARFASSALNQGR